MLYNTTTKKSVKKAVKKVAAKKAVAKEPSQEDLLQRDVNNLQVENEALKAKIAKLKKKLKRK